MSCDSLNETSNWVLLLIKSSAGPSLFVVETEERACLRMIVSNLKVGEGSDGRVPILSEMGRLLEKCPGFCSLVGAYKTSLDL
jgi:hypothetical protein